jgi:hypothetical protein
MKHWNNVQKKSGNSFKHLQRVFMAIVVNKSLTMMQNRVMKAPLELNAAKRLKIRPRI